MPAAIPTPAAIIVYDQHGRGTSTRSCWSGRSSKMSRLAQRARRHLSRRPDGVSIPAYLTLAARQRRPQPAGRSSCRTADRRRATNGASTGSPNISPISAMRCFSPISAGSAGYGDEWLQQNGFQGWRTSIGDITAGARWLAAQGIGDPNRMAIVGWSYGGYAALQSGVTEPSLFKAIVAIAPVTDLQQAQGRLREYHQPRGTSPNISAAGPHIARRLAAAERVQSITAPVLLFHGDRDLNVPVIHSQQHGPRAARRRPPERARRLPGPRARPRRQRGPAAHARPDPRLPGRPAGTAGAQRARGPVGTGPTGSEGSPATPGLVGSRYAPSEEQVPADAAGRGRCPRDQRGDTSTLW